MSIYCIYHDCRMAHEATRAVMNLPLAPELTAKIASYLYGHKWYAPQIDLTLSDDEEDVILTPGPLDSDDDMPVTPVKPRKFKRLRRAVVYSDSESDSDYHYDNGSDSDVEMLD